MLTIIAQAPHYCLQWMDAEHTILKLGITQGWSVFQAIEVLHLLRCVLKNYPTTAFDIIVSIDDGIRVELTGLAFKEFMGVLRSPSPNLGRVVFCGHYPSADALIKNIDRPFPGGGREAGFIYVSSCDEALDVIQGCR